MLLAGKMPSQRTTTIPPPSRPGIHRLLAGISTACSSILPSGVPGHVVACRGGADWWLTSMNDMYIYDAAFQNMAATGSAYAASRIISIVQSIMPVQSVVDIGCARGTWLREWQAHGVNDVVGVDGDYVDRARLEISPSCFVVHDLAAQVQTSGAGSTWRKVSKSPSTFPRHAQLHSSPTS